jgi:hypothetical protein
MTIQTVIDEFLKREELEYVLETAGMCDEFSWHICDCCKSELGGARYIVWGHHKAGTFRYTVCTDCMEVLA